MLNKWSFSFHLTSWRQPSFGIFLKLQTYQILHSGTIPEKYHLLSPKLSDVGNDKKHFAIGKLRNDTSTKRLQIGNVSKYSTFQRGTPENYHTQVYLNTEYLRTILRVVSVTTLTFPKPSHVRGSGGGLTFSLQSGKHYTPYARTAFVSKHKNKGWSVV